MPKITKRQILLDTEYYQTLKIPKKKNKFNKSKFRFHTPTVGFLANMLSFVKNRKGGNNLLDANGYLYRVSKAVKDRSRTGPTGIVWPRKVMPALQPPSQCPTATS
jgi:hypothetical protein